jgi:hypothetical protein
MKPLEAFSFIDQLLAAQRLSLTPPEWHKFSQAMQIVAEAIQKQSTLQDG